MCDFCPLSTLHYFQFTNTVSVYKETRTTKLILTLYGLILPRPGKRRYGKIAYMKGKNAQERNHHHRVALLIETSHEFGREVLRGIRDFEKAQKNHWAFFLQPDGMQQEVPKIGSWQCTGVIARLFSSAATKMLLTSGLPLVLLDPYTEHLSKKYEIAHIPYITTDTDEIVRMAFEHLHACGCRNFAFVHSVTDTVWSVARERAFVRLAAQRGFACHVYGNQPAVRPWEEEIRHLGAWLARLPHGLGVFAAMDQRGRHVIEACREAGLLVPDDVIVLSVDNDPLLCELCEPSLSSIALDAYRAGYEAAQTLSRLMSGHKVPPNTRILVKATHVSRRQSTATGFDQDRVVADARRYIFSRFSDKSMQVPDIATQCGVSRRLLEMRFSLATGRTLLQELTEVRMERARTLLRDTDDTVTEIAAASGFADANYFTKAFRHCHGLAPLRYREEAHAV
jgi:LacI family transcriptional regulator